MNDLDAGVADEATEILGDAPDTSLATKYTTAFLPFSTEIASGTCDGSGSSSGNISSRLADCSRHGPSWLSQPPCRGGPPSVPLVAL